MSEHFTKTETLRRLRVLTKAAKDATGLPRNTMSEVGLREYPQHFDRHPSARDIRINSHPQDDLYDMRAWDDASREEQVQRHGAVVHIYLYGPFYLGGNELIDVVVGWMGTPDEDPQLV